MSDLPPLDQPQAYVVVGPNDQRGTYTLDLLIGEVVAGRLHDATPVWWPGLAEWTTMNGHPGLAAEIARRRASAAPAPVEQPQTYDPAPAAPYEQPQTYDPAPAAPYQQPQTYEAGQYESTGDAAAAYGTAEPVASASGQDYSYDASGGMAVGADLSPAPEAEQPVGNEPSAAGAPDGVTAVVAEVPDGSGAVASDVPAGWTVTDTSTPAAVEAPAEYVEAEVVGTSTVTDEHRSLFADVVGRSRARSGAGDRIAALDAAVADAVVSGAESQGFTNVDRTAGETNHDLRFDGGAGESLTITLGRIKGSDPAAVVDGDVPLTVRFQAATYVGELDAGTGEHGEVIIVSDEWSGQATSTVGLLLPLADYVSADLDLDAVSLLRDVGATVSVVSDRLR